MRISDWSSDVCSSDLANFPGAARILGQLTDGSARKRVGLTVEGKLPVREGAGLFDGDTEVGVVTSGGFAPSFGAPIAMGYVPRGLSRSEEHTSELQSLMRISYAVFCLKKKKTNYEQSRKSSD